MAQGLAISVTTKATSNARTARSSSGNAGPCFLRREPGVAVPVPVPVPVGRAVAVAGAVDGERRALIEDHVVDGVVDAPAGAPPGVLLEGRRIRAPPAELLESLVVRVPVGHEADARDRAGALD